MKFRIKKNNGQVYAKKIDIITNIDFLKKTTMTTTTLNIIFNQIREKPKKR